MQRHRTKDTELSKEGKGTETYINQESRRQCQSFSTAAGIRSTHSTSKCLETVKLEMKWHDSSLDLNRAIKPRLLSEHLPIALQVPTPTSIRKPGTSLKDQYSARPRLHLRLRTENKREEKRRKTKGKTRGKGRKRNGPQSKQTPPRSDFPPTTTTN